MLGIVIVDHGSRRAEANDAFLGLVERFAVHSGCAIVEPAHMELAAPSLADAFARVVARGATEIVVHPCFLLPGRHFSEDIPALCAAAASPHGNLPWKITGPLGDSPRLLEAIQECIDAVVRP